ncbi:MAG: hypothetical protein HZB19_02155 [Chloroflexi bacterium]|nr:hypothetical protein [Chloroflexota bacterium]
MKQLRKVNGLLETLVVIGLILIIPLFFAIKTAADRQEASDTSVPLVPTTSEVPESNSATVAKQPPQCTFPLAQITTAESTPEEYTFSEPQVVLTAPKGNVHNIIEWLPDNQQILITEDLRNNYVYKNDNAPQQSISLYNPETGESKVYAIRTEINEPPSWQPELNAVVYPVMNYTSIDKKNGAYKFTRQAWVSYGDPDTAQMLADNLLQLPLAIKPGGREMIYLSDKKISKLDKSLKKLPSVLFDPAQWDYGKERRDQNPISYKMAWQPRTSLLFLYSDGIMGGGGYTFILNADTGEICELDFWGWATGAHWSSDGHYLAIGRAAKSHPADLTLLDTVTGKLTTLGGTPQEIEGKLYINDFIWTPDNYHLLAIGSVISSQDNQGKNNIQGLYLVDIVSGQSIDITPTDNFYTNSPQSMAWSPDGSKLAIRCPTMELDRICFISVQRTGQ